MHLRSRSLSFAGTMALAAASVMAMTAASTAAASTSSPAANPTWKCRNFNQSVAGSQTWGTICWNQWESGIVTDGVMNGTVRDTSGSDNKCAYAKVKATLHSGSYIAESTRACGLNRTVNFGYGGRYDVKGIWVAACREGSGCGPYG